MLGYMRKNTKLILMKYASANAYQQCYWRQEDKILCARQPSCKMLYFLYEEEEKNGIQRL